jgi:hypothetical protein
MSWEKFPNFLGKITKGICKGWSIIAKKPNYNADFVGIAGNK